MRRPVEQWFARRLSTRPLTEDERRMILRAMALIAIPLATICVLALLIGGAVAFHYIDNSIDANSVAIKEAEEASNQAKLLARSLNAERRTRERTLAWQVYDECVQNENQDASNVLTFRKVRALLQQGKLTPASQALIDTLTDTINSREPPGEPDCTRPSFPRPSGEAQP